MNKSDKIPPERAAALLRDACSAPDETRELPLLDAVGRVCAEQIAADVCQPPFDRSARDGYAVRIADLAGARAAAPVALPVSRRLYAGSAPQGPLAPGTAARIMTGAPVPEGADCVVPQERADGGEREVGFSAAPPVGENICRRGEDFPEGTVLARRGERLNYAVIGLLAGQGRACARVYRRARVAVLATGDELCPPGTALSPGKIHDSNQAMLCARLLELGVKPVAAAIGPDDPDALCARMREALAGCDLLITTGGVSVGQRDYLPLVTERLGCRRLFYGVDMKPGSPALGAVLDGKPVLCLSGNPFAAAATFELLARPALRRLSGDRETYTPRCRAVLRNAFPRPSKKRRFVRAALCGGAVAVPDAGHSSGGIGSLRGCNCLIDIPAGSPPLRAGDEVEVLLL